MNGRRFSASMAMDVIQPRRTGVLSAVSACLPLAFGGCGAEQAAPVAPSAPDTVGPTASNTVVDSIWVRPPERTIGLLGTRFRPYAEALAVDGTWLYSSVQDPGRFSWSSSAPEIASVSGDTVLDWGATRFVTGLSDGTATITATSQGVTGRLTVTVRERARLAWSVPLEWSFAEGAGTGSIQAGVAIGADGTIYVGWNDSAARRSHWSALSPQGGVLWTLDLPGTGSSTPAIGADGTLYLGSWSDSGTAGSLIAVDPGGSIRWILDDLDAIYSSPALGPDGTIYVAGGRHVHAVDPQGEIQWTYQTAGRTFSRSSPAVARDGTIYVGGMDDHLHAIDPDGAPRWTFETGDLIRAPPSIGLDGTIYVASYDGRLYAVHPDGSERWSVVVKRSIGGVSGQVNSPPSIGPDGAIYVLGRGLFAINPDGSIRWHFHSSTAGYRTTPILGADGNVYLASGPAVTALDARGRLLWDYQPGGGDIVSGVYILASPAIGVDGTIIATSFSDRDGGAIHGIVETESANGGYAGSPWPAQRGNRANTGRAGG